MALHDRPVFEDFGTASINAAADATMNWSIVEVALPG
jgi:hypothetical protein